MGKFSLLYAQPPQPPELRANVHDRPNRLKQIPAQVQVHDARTRFGNRLVRRRLRNGDAQTVQDDRPQILDLRQLLPDLVETNLLGNFAPRDLDLGLC